MPKPQSRPDESALRGLVGSGPSQLGVSGAMRVRDVLRLTPEDIELAESRVVVKHAVARPEQPGPNQPGPNQPRPDQPSERS
ncbi:MAG: hypothetical protein QOE64_430 [Frankiales bacterium]|nr:hypothetical protein [Frankiales bacterium]